MLRISEDDGTTRVVLLKKDLPLADGIAVQGDKVVLVNLMKKLWVLKSQEVGEKEWFITKLTSRKRGSLLR
ncbi:hypothetical protein TorRG33x02_207010 [Trema orientale]|uniref:Uncharacterized protein n=1 Tax=Trema orientale TaxID=63057 RepID=A0A2P5EDB5_TREOI|nr:hypothetical protein TorRG33x02_207010 [Trema orientale]